MVYNYANVGNCRILFAHLEKQIEDIVPTPYKVTNRWAKVLATFWENRRRTNAAARGLASRFTFLPPKKRRHLETIPPRLLTDQASSRQDHPPPPLPHSRPLLKP